MRPALFLWALVTVTFVVLPGAVLPGRVRAQELAMGRIVEAGEMTGPRNGHSATLLVDGRALGPGVAGMGVCGGRSAGRRGD